MPKKPERVVLTNKLLTVVFPCVAAVLVTASGAGVFDFGQSQAMLDAFDGERHGVPAAETQEGDAFGCAVPLEGVKQGDQLTGAAGADGVADGYCATMHVDFGICPISPQMEGAFPNLQRFPISYIFIVAVL
jgi:hypothetical protein